MFSLDPAFFHIIDEAASKSSGDVYIVTIDGKDGFELVADPEVSGAGLGESFLQVRSEL